jgi:hypothetical protein
VRSLPNRASRGRQDGGSPSNRAAASRSITIRGWMIGGRPEGNDGAASLTRHRLPADVP